MSLFAAGMMGGGLTLAVIYYLHRMMQFRILLVLSGRTQLFRDVLSSGPFSQHGQVLSTGLKETEIIEGYGAYNWTFDASRSVRTASETRPRNVAFNYIVRAA